MSADSQRSRLSAGGGGVGGVGGGGGSGSGGGGAVRCMPTIVPPQAVSDRSIIDSVAGFINDVTLQGQTPLGDSKDHILWVRFENAADISDPCLGDDWELEGGIAPPLLLILGYVTGVQVWIVPANGEAIEVLSWRHGSVKCLRVLPTPSAGSERESTAADQTDQYTHKRPLIALCESASVAGGSAGGAAAAAAAAGGSNGGYQYCAVNFVSLKDGETVKSIKFKSTIVDILANRSSIVVTFPERIAVFDARTLEDRLTVTTCHPSPGLNPNPVALGSRWIAYAERRLIASKRSSGGCEGDGVTSYTATVLNAAKSLGKGLRELGEQVAAGLTGSHLGSSLVGGGGGGSGSGSSLGGGFGGGMAGLGGGGGGSSDLLHGGGGLLMGSEGNQQPGVVTVLDIKHPIKDISPTTGTPVTCHGSDPIVAHFLAHSEAIVALAFDAPGMLLLTADRRGHDFHVFRLHPHPSGASLAAVHHLYVLHRGDTTAKVQDISFSLDSRWVAVSTLRGTTHVFPVTPYGGPAGVRTHGSPLVVNRLSRFHRSAGLSIDGRSSSPVSHLAVGEAGSGAHHAPSAAAYANPRTPPFPHPTIVQPLAQLRQPASLAVVGGGGGSGGVGGGGGGGGGAGGSGIGGKGSALGRQRNSSSSSSDDLVKPLRVCATFAKARSWLLDPPGCSVRDTPAHRIQRKPVDSLFIMAAHGALIQYDLEPKHASGTPKEKICDDTPIELEVEAKAQWCLQRQENASTGDIQPPLSLDNWLIKDRFLEDGGSVKLDYGEYHYKSSARELDKQQLPSLGSAVSVDHDERWLSQVEIITHAGPHRRLWMGPQFMFKTYNTPSGSPLSSIDTDAVEICTVGGSGGGGAGGSANLYNRPLQRSNPMNMPLAGGSYEQSPRMMNMNEFRHHENLDTEFSSLGPVESQLREDLADAMRESPLIATGRDTAAGQQQQQQHPVAAHPHQQAAHLTSTSTHHHPLASATGLSSVSSCSSTSIYSSTHSLSSICDHQQQQQQQQQLYHHHQQQQHCGCKGAPASAAGGGGVGGEGDGAGSYFECKQPAFAGAGDGSGNASALVVSGAPHGASVGGLRGAVGMLTIAKVVNPLGTVTTISGGDGAGGVGGSGGGGGAGGGGGPDSLGSDEFMQECGEPYLHENCDEALFRPVVTVRGGGDVDGGGDGGGAARRYRGSSLDRTGGLTAGGYETRPISQPASLIGRDLIVPVIEEKHLPYFGGTSRVQQAAKEQQQQQQRAKSKPAGEAATTAPADTITIPSAAVAAAVCEEFVNVELPPAGDGEGKEQQKAATRSVARKEKPTGAPKAKKGTAGEKRTGGKQRSSSGKEQQQPATADRGKRVAADEAMVVVVEQVLPPLEALKIDDLELFGEEPDVDGRGQPELVVPASEKHRGFDDPVPVPAPAQSSSSSPPPSPPLPLPPAPLAPLELPDLLEDDDTGGGPPPPEGEDVGGERTLISFESPLQERAPHRLSEQMQGVLARGNILLAMCSSLREASPGVAPTVAPSDEEPSRRGVVAKEPSLEGQDSDYKSLELDSEVPQQQQQQEQEQPASAGVTIVSLHSSASEDDQRCPAVGAEPEPEEENEAETEAEIARSEDGADSSSGSALSKRRRHKRSSSHRTNANVTTTSSSSSSSSTATTMVISLATADNDANDDDNEDDDNDDADDDDEDDDEEQVDEELQPLISSNKTSSSSLSVTVGHGTAATASEPPVQHDQGPCDDLMLLHAAATGGSELTAITPSRTALPTDSEDGEGGRSGTIASKHDRPTTATTSSTTTTGLPANKSRPAAATLPNAQNASNKPSTIGGGGGGGGGGVSGGSNGKKKSKKKRK